jgi:hypothetical protein
MRLSVAATEPAPAVRNSLFFGKRNSVTFTLVPFAPITVESKPDSLGACDDGGFSFAESCDTDPGNQLKNRCFAH